MNATTCPLCNVPVGPKQTYCSRCEQLLSGNAPLTAAPKPKWYHNVWFVLFMLSPFALGPFALPLLWKSPRFSRNAKIVLTVVTLAATAWVAWYTMKVIVPAFTNKLNELNSIFSP